MAELSLYHRHSLGPANLKSQNSSCDKTVARRHVRCSSAFAVISPPNIISLLLAVTICQMSGHNSTRNLTLGISIQSRAEQRTNQIECILNKILLRNVKSNLVFKTITCYIWQSDPRVVVFFPARFTDNGRELRVGLRVVVVTFLTISDIQRRYFMSKCLIWSEGGFSKLLFVIMNNIVYVWRLLGILGKHS